MSIFKSRFSLWFILLIFTIAWGVPASAQQQAVDDPGLTAVRDAGLGVFPNQSQTIGDTTVTLNWVYADVHRIALSYEVVSAMSPGIFYRSQFNLTDNADSFYMARNGGGSGMINSQGNAEYIYSFGAGFYNEDIQTITLRAEIALEPETGNFGGGGSGFGTGIPLPDYTPAPGIFADTGVQNPVGTFVFEVSLPVLPAVRSESGQTVEANGVTLTLESISTTPSMTIVVICNQISETDYWRPVTTMGVNEQAVAASSSITLPTESGGRGCTDLAFPVAQSESDITQIRVDYLMGSPVDGIAFTDESAEFFRAYLAERGVVIQIDGINARGRLDYSILSQPDGDVGSILQEAWEASLFERLTGPWVFNLDSR